MTADSGQFTLPALRPGGVRLSSQFSVPSPSPAAPRTGAGRGAVLRLGSQLSVPARPGAGGGAGGAGGVEGVPLALPQQLGHRRRRKVSMNDLQEMQWEKKSQPVRRLSHTTTETEA